MNKSTKKKLIIIAGATAVGKTELSIKLAKKIGGEIISVDSMQVYRGMDIGTAKISKDEMDGIPHHLIDILDPKEPFSVFEFQTLTKKAMEEIYAKGKIPILVGGTGFFIQSVLYDIEFSDETGDKTYRNGLEELAKEQGVEVLHQMLEAVDPESAADIHANNVKRVLRALEFYHETGEKISAHNKEQSQKESPYDFLYIVLNRDRDEVYERINHRVDLMVEEGLVEEVKRLLDQGVPKEAQSMQGLGYKEIVRYLEGDCSLEEAVETLKTGTRHFAKRQITWFKREPFAIWMNYKDYDGDIESMIQTIINKL